MKVSEKQEISCQNTPNNPVMLHRRGLIPGPAESATAFAIRALLPPLHAHPLPSFLATPDWPSILTHKPGLCFWEGAATWIEEKPDHTRFCSIQLRSRCLFYSTEEILSHEMVHAMRLMFDEPQFEEILAFRSSPHSLRRYLGPLLSHPGEARGFLFLTLFSWIAYILSLIFLTEGAPLILFLPCASVLFSLLRLARSQHLFSRALQHLSPLLSCPQHPLAALLYLTDEEIHLFSRLSSSAILSYVHQQTCPRWKQWRACFISNDVFEMQEQSEGLRDT